tara:strand:+ start:2513 stop:3235 length:723 start_codon:yes stop_codon:yes gene_type:complete
MNLKNVIIAGLLIGSAHGMTVPAKAHHPELDNPVSFTDKITKGYHTMDAMGCMLLRECTDGVNKVKSISDIDAEYPNSDFGFVTNEFNSILSSLDRIGVEVFLADSKYFPIGHRGVYHTVSNNFFLNRAFMHRPSTLMSVMRHEGWHAAQDCMAGSIENNMIAIIHNEDDVPKIWQDIATKTYKDMPHAIPWEKEAFWAGKTLGMTQKALDACAAGKMWEVYEPTPMTGEWLRENGFMSK